MRKINYLASVMLLLSASSIFSQNVTDAEYFIDTDQGIGSNTSIPVTIGQTITQEFTIPLTSISNGLHTLYVRAKDSNGKWSMVSAETFLKIDDPVGDLEITAAEYFIDTDLGIGSNTSISLTPGFTIAEEVLIPLLETDNGLHQVYIRVKDSNSHWSIYGNTLLLKLEDPTATPNILKAEYFFDDEPGLGQGTSLTFDPQNQTVSAIINPDISELSQGLHTLNIRVQDENSKWSLTSQELIEVINDDLRLIKRLDYQYLGPDSFVSATYSFNLESPKTSLDSTIALNTTELTFNETYTLIITPIDSRNTSGLSDSVDFIYDGSILWIGGASGAETDWGEPQNWDLHSVPSENDKVIVTSTSNDPIINGQYSLKDLLIEEDASVSLESGASLAIYGTATNLGTYSVNRNLTGSSSLSILSSPVANATIESLNADHSFEFDGSSYSKPTGNMIAGKGYFIGYNETEPTATFTGTPNFGTIEIPIGSGNYELLGNPYSAPISIADFLTDNDTVIAGAVYFWDDGGSNVDDKRGGDYITANSIGAVGISQPDNSDDQVDGLKGTGPAENGIIPSTQGFYVEAIKSESVTFTAEHQTTSATANDDSNFYRIIDFQRLKLALEGEGFYNEILFGFSPDATLERDLALDAKKIIGNSEFAFYSLIENEKYSIQGRPLADTINIIPLGYRVMEEGDYNIRLVDKELDEHWLIEVLDQLTNTTYNLSEINEMNLKLTPEEANDRFSLAVSRKTEVLGSKESMSFNVYGSVEELTLEAQLKEAVVTINDLTGRIIYQEQVSFVNNRQKIQPELRINTIYVISVDNYSIKFILR